MLNFLVALSIITNTLIIKVTNGTEPSKPLKNIMVSVVGFDTTNNIKFSKSVKPRNGIAVIKRANPKLFYQAEVNYKGVSYLSDVGQFKGDTLTLEVPVYDVTDKDDDIELTNYHIVIFPEPQTGGYYIVEALNLNNQGNKTFNAQYYVYFFLPHGTDSITFIQPQNEEKWMVVGDTVFYNDVVYPGNQTIAFNYIAPGEKLTLHREFPKRITSAQIFTAPGVKVKSKFFKNQGEQNINGQTYVVYNLSKPTESFDLEISKGPVPGGGSSKSNVEIPIAIAVAVIVLVIIIFLRLKTVRGGAKVSKEEEDLLEELKKLIELRDKGILSKEDFNKAKKKICDKL